MGGWLSSGVKLASVLVFGVMAGGVLDDMVLMSSYVACCVVHFDLLLGGHRILRWGGKGVLGPRLGKY